MADKAGRVSQELNAKLKKRLEGAVNWESVPKISLADASHQSEGAYTPRDPNGTLFADRIGGGGAAALPQRVSDPPRKLDQDRIAKFKTGDSMFPNKADGSAEDGTEGAIPEGRQTAPAALPSISEIPSEKGDEPLSVETPSTQSGSPHTDESNEQDPPPKIRR